MCIRDRRIAEPVPIGFVSNQRTEHWLVGSDVAGVAPYRSFREVEMGIAVIGQQEPSGGPDLKSLEFFGSRCV